MYLVHQVKEILQSEAWSEEVKIIMLAEQNKEKIQQVEMFGDLDRI